MNNNFTDKLKTLDNQVAEIHNLTIDTCKMCGGTYEENLDGATAYFNINGEHFKITIEKV